MQLKWDDIPVYWPSRNYPPTIHIFGDDGILRSSIPSACSGSFWIISREEIAPFDGEWTRVVVAESGRVLRSAESDGHGRFRAKLREACQVFDLALVPFDKLDEICMADGFMFDIYVVAVFISFLAREPDVQYLGKKFPNESERSAFLTNLRKDIVRSDEYKKKLGTYAHLPGKDVVGLLKPQKSALKNVCLEFLGSV